MIPSHERRQKCLQSCHNCGLRNPSVSLIRGNPNCPNGSGFEGCIHERTQLPANWVGGGWEELGHEHDSNLVLRIDPECGTGSTAPEILADIAGRQGASAIEHDREPETETKPGVNRLAEERS